MKCYISIIVMLFVIINTTFAQLNGGTEGTVTQGDVLIPPTAGTASGDVTQIGNNYLIATGPYTSPSGATYTGKDILIDSSGNIISAKEIVPCGKGICTNVEFVTNNGNMQLVEKADSIELLDGNADGVEKAKLYEDGSYEFGKVHQLNTENFKLANAYNVRKSQNSLILESAEKFSVESASALKAGNLLFNEIGPSSFTLDNNDLSYAYVESRKDNNFFEIAGNQVIFDQHNVIKTNFNKNNLTIDSVNSIIFKSPNVTVLFGQGSTLSFDYNKGINCVMLGKDGEIIINETKLLNRGSSQLVCLSNLYTNCTVLSTLGELKHNLTLYKKEVEIIRTYSGNVKYIENNEIVITDCFDAILFSRSFEINCSNPLRFKFTTFHPYFIKKILPNTTIHEGMLTSGTLRMYEFQSKPYYDVLADFYNYVARGFR